MSARTCSPHTSRAWTATSRWCERWRTSTAITGIRHTLPARRRTPNCFHRTREDVGGCQGGLTSLLPCDSVPGDSQEESHATFCKPPYAARQRCCILRVARHLCSHLIRSLSPLLPAFDCLD